MAGNPPDYEENGRLYHGYRKGIYMFPCDEVREPLTKLFSRAASQAPQTLD
jgi:hypothetical protein